MGKPDAPAPPDFGPIARASEKAAELSAQIAREQLTWAKEQYWNDREITDLVIESALTRMDEQDANAREDRQRYEEIFQPLEDDLAQDAANYASPERMEQEAGKAQADVSQQFELARNAAQDRLESFGIDPSQVRAGALDVSARMQEAAARASAGNQARDRTENIGRVMRSEAINVGRGYPGQIAGQLGTALQSGNQAVNSGIATTQSGVQSMGSPVQWQQQSVNALGQWNQALLNQGTLNLKTWEAENNASSGVGSILGLIGGVGTKLMGFEKGGAVPEDEEGVTPGGKMAVRAGMAIPPYASPSRGAVVDDVPAAIGPSGAPAMLNEGEFIVPDDVTAWYGEKFFQDLIMKARKGKDEAPAKPEMRPAPRQAIPTE